MTRLPEAQQIQAHWNSVITAAIVRDAALLKLLPWGEPNYAKLAPHVLDPMKRLAADILKRSCEAQVANPRSMRVITERLTKEIWNALREFSAVKTGHALVLDFDPYPDPPVTKPTGTTTSLQTSARRHGR